MVKSTFSFYNHDALHKTLLIHEDLFLRMSQVDESIVEIPSITSFASALSLRFLSIPFASFYILSPTSLCQQTMCH